MPKALSPLQSDQRSYTSELSWYPEFSEFGESEKKKLVSTEEEGNLDSPVTKVAAVTMAAELL
jgi:hypothetical protein